MKESFPQNPESRKRKKSRLLIALGLVAGVAATGALGKKESPSDPSLINPKKDGAPLNPGKQPPQLEGRGSRKELGEEEGVNDSEETSREALIRQTKERKPQVEEIESEKTNEKARAKIAIIESVTHEYEEDKRSPDYEFSEEMKRAVKNHMLKMHEELLPLIRILRRISDEKAKKIEKDFNRYLEYWRKEGVEFPNEIFTFKN